MKSILLPMVIGLILIAQVAYAAPVLNIVLSSQNPYPVEPGEIVSVEVEIQNVGYEEARNVVIEVEPQAPFTLIAGEQPVKTFTRIESLSSVKSSYRFLVASDAESGDYDLVFLRYTSEDSDLKVRKEITVSVRGNPNLVLRDVSSSPAKIEPGKSVEITAVIENVGTGDAHYVGATLNSSSTYLLPELAGGEFYMGDIKAGESREAEFIISVDNLAEYKTYSSVLTLSYEDETGSSLSRTFSVGIPVRGEPVIEILSTKVDNGDLKVDIENIGTADAKALRIALVQNGEEKDSAIANELKPSKHKTIRFRGFSYGKAEISIKYLDETNTEHKEVTEINIKQSVFEEEGGSSGLEMFTGLFLIVIVLETFYIWRFRKKRK